MNTNDQFDKQSSNIASTEQPILAENTENRRNALNKIGRYSAYIAPAMLAIFSTQAHAS